MTTYKLKWEGSAPEGDRAHRKGLPNAVIAASRAQALRFLADMLDVQKARYIPRRLTITAQRGK